MTDSPPGIQPGTEGDLPAELTPGTDPGPLPALDDDLDTEVDPAPDAPPAQPTRLGRYRTGRSAIDDELLHLLDHVGAARDRDQLFEILASGVRLAGDGAERLDLKITNAALKEMRAAFRAFAPYRHIPKVTIFGSARTQPADATYVQARNLAQQLAGRGYMVVTGAGPGIMAAGLEGAGRDASFGVNIRLPFEQSANAFIAGDTKLVSMKYFFTRKLMLMKESAAFVSLPGGFGTLDETFELLTLLQTGKAQPAPVVLLDSPGGGFWTGLRRFLQEDVAPRHLIDDDDVHLVTFTDSTETACEEIIRFNRNFHSIRWVGERLVMRVRHAPTDVELAELNTRFGPIATDGIIRNSPALPAEVSTDDHLELARVVLRYNGFAAGQLRLLIDALNSLPSLDASDHPSPL
jgi:uncharacterized protein (TIGR00730 family)